MKVHHLVLIFIPIFFVAFIVFGFISQKAVSYSTTDKEFSLMLTSACDSSLKVLDREDFDGKNVFTNKNRKIAINTFYKTLAYNMNLADSPVEQIIKGYVPLLILVDNNGFYMIYSPSFNNSKDIIMLDGFEEPIVLSSLYTWSKSYNEYIVRFFLDDYLEIITPDGEKITGHREEMLKKVPLDKVPCLIDEATFELEKREYILSKIENEINLCLNTQKMNVDGYFTGYTVTLPFHEGSDYADTIRVPSLIALMQGNQAVVSDKMYNVYSFVIAEIGDAH